MKQGSGRFVAAALAILMLVLPGTLSAGRWNGIDLIITCLDGRQVRGELIAVKTDTLVLFGTDAKVESVLLTDIKNIRICRKSKAWQGLLGGFLAGAVGGAIWGGLSGGEEWGLSGGAILGAFLVAIPASLPGLVVGMAAGLDDEIDLAGLPETERNRILAKLSRQARAPEVYVPQSRTPTAGEPGKRPAPSRYDRTRFKLTWMPGYRVGGRGDFTKSENIAFRFTEDLPPEEAGPYASSWRPFEDGPRFSSGRMTLAYAWSRQLASEVELCISDRWTDLRSGDLRFTSTLNGLSYFAYFGSHEEADSTSLLIGLSFRPLLPAFFKPHSIELGVAAGPAWISWRGRNAYDYPSDYDGTDRHRSMTWAARARVSYDYYFNPAVSMGAFAEYRRIQADIPSYSRTELLVFNESNYDVSALTRWTEVTFPGRTIALGGMTCGLRFGLSF
jgi:hypothetical protein